MCWFPTATVFLVLFSATVSLAEIKDACPFDLKDISGWDIAEFEKGLLKEAYGVPKHSFGYRFITEAPTGFVDDSRDATRILGSVFEPFLYKLNATKPDLPPHRTCSHANWKEKLSATGQDGAPADTIRDDLPQGPDCIHHDCSCYMRYSDSCPMTGYKTYYLPVPWWWCYYDCQTRMTS